MTFDDRDSFKTEREEMSLNSQLNVIGGTFSEDIDDICEESVSFQMEKMSKAYVQ